MESLLSQKHRKKIFTPATITGFRRFVHWKQITQSILCEWDDDGTLKMIKKPLKVVRFCIGALLAWTYAVYLVIQLVHYISGSSHFNGNIVDALWTFLWGLYYWWAVGNYCNTVLKQDDAVLFYNGMMQLDTHLADTIILQNNMSDTSKRSQQKWKDISILEVAMIVEDFMVVSFAACGSIMALALSHKPAFISSVLEQQCHSISFLVAFSLFEFYTIAATCGGITFFCNYLCTYMIMTFQWINTLGKESLIEMQDQVYIKTLKNYRKLRLLNAYFNHAHSSAAYPMTMFLYFSTSIITFYGSVRLKQINFVEYILFPMACTFLLMVFSALLYGSGSVYASSCTFLDRFVRCPALQRNKLRSKWVTKQMNALTPFGVRIGTFPFITKRSVLVVYAVWSNYAASLLIAYSSSAS